MPPKLRRLVFLTRLFHALGFRWVFVWTMPIPFHPLIPLAMLVAIPVLIAWRIAQVATGGSGGATWTGLLAAAALLAIPLTIPIVNWFALVFRLAHIQALLIGGAMLLIAVEVALGRAPPGLAALPLAYAALYLVQRIGGPIALRRIEQENAAFTPIDPGARQIIFEGDTVAGSYGSWLMGHCDLADVLVTPSARKVRGVRPMNKRYIRLTPAHADEVRAAITYLREDNWWIGDGGIVTTPAGPADPDAIRIRTRRHHSPLWLIEGYRLLIEIEVDGRVQRLIGGKAAVVGNIPLFVAFRWIAIFGGKSQWVVGFARAKAADLGTSRIYDMLAHALPPLPEAGATRFTDGSALVAEATRRADERRAEGRAALDELIDSLGKDDRTYVTTYALLRHREVAFGQGERLCDGLAKARETDDKLAATTFARLLGELPNDEYKALSGRLIALLNSKALAFRLLGGDDPNLVNAPARERDKHVIGGFSLVKNAPRLYERLSELGEPARFIIMGLGELGRWPDALQKARDRLDAKPPA